MHWKNILPPVAIFLLGVLAGFGLGNLNSNNFYNAQLEQKITDLQNRFQTVNDNYMTLVREYNKLFALETASGQNVSAVAAATTVPPKPTVAQVNVKATPPPVAVNPTPTPAAVNPSATTAAAPPTVTATAIPPTVAPAAKPTAATGPTTAAPSAGGAKPKSNFKALAIDGTGELEGPPPLDVKFTDLSTGGITTWKWEFGDGESSTEQNPTHTYKQCPGENKLCTVKLTVCGPDGCDIKSIPDYLWVSESCSGC